jgi:sarcosine oxidase subunit gamma
MKPRYAVTLSRPERPALFEVHAHEPAIPSLEAAIAAKLPSAPSTQHSEASTIYCLGPKQWLVRAPLATESQWEERLQLAIVEHSALVTLMTDALALFRVTGDDALAVLSQGIAIDLHPAQFGAGSATRCGLAKTSAIVHCLTPGLDYELIVDGAFEAYVERWLRAAAGEVIRL